MGFWDTVKTDLKKAVEEGWSVVRDGAKIAADKSEEVAKTGKLKYKAHLLHKDAEKVFADLGGLIYDLANRPTKRDPLANPEVKRLIEEIRDLENNASVMEDSITNIKLQNVKSTLKVSTKLVETAQAKKAAPKKKAAPRKAAPKKKVVARKAAPRKAAPKKAVARKAAPKKAAPKKKVVAKKVAPKKAAPKKG